MIDRPERCFDLKPKRIAADTAYGTGRLLALPGQQAGLRCLSAARRALPHRRAPDQSCG